MASPNRDSGNAARAKQMKDEGVVRRVFRHPVSGKLVHGATRTEINPVNKRVGTTIDGYGVIVFGKG